MVVMENVVSIRSGDLANRPLPESLKRIQRLVFPDFANLRLLTPLAMQLEQPVAVNGLT